MFTKLSAQDLAQQRATGGHPEYVEFLGTLAVGEGGRVDVKKAGVSRQWVKNRLNKAAASTGTKLRFMRSGADTIEFEVIETGHAPKARRARRT